MMCTTDPKTVSRGPLGVLVGGRFGFTLSVSRVRPKNIPYSNRETLKSRIHTL